MASEVRPRHFLFLLILSFYFYRLCIADGTSSKIPEPSKASENTKASSKLVETTLAATTTAAPMKTTSAPTTTTTSKPTSPKPLFEITMGIFVEDASLTSEKEVQDVLDNFMEDKIRVKTAHIKNLKHAMDAYKDGTYDALITAISCDKSHRLAEIESRTYLITFVAAYCHRFHIDAQATKFGINFRVTNVAGDVAPLLADLANTIAFTRWRETVLLIEEPNDWEDNFASDILKSVRRVGWVTNLLASKTGKVAAYTQPFLNMVTPLRVCVNERTASFEKLEKMHVKRGNRTYIYNTTVLLDMYKDDLKASSFIVLGSQQYVLELFQHGADYNINFMQHWREFVVVIKDPIDKAFRDKLLAVMKPEGKMLLLASKNQPQKLCPVVGHCHVQEGLKAYKTLALKRGSSGIIFKGKLGDNSQHLAIRKDMAEVLNRISTCGLCSIYEMWRFKMDMSTPSLDHVADWSLANGVTYMKDVSKDKTQFYEDLLPAFKDGFGKNIVLRIGIFHYPPVTMIEYKKDKNGRNTDEILRVNGTYGDMIQVFAWHMNFTIKWVVSKEPEPGMHDSKGNFTRGLMGQIARNETDIALYPFLVTKQRSKIVDFTTGIEGTYVRYMVIWPHIDYKFLFFLPFAWDTWVCTFATLILTPALLWCMHKTSKFYEYNEMKRDGGLNEMFNCYWYVWCAYIQQGGVHLPEASSGRMLVSFWWLFVVISMTSYSGQMVAEFTFPRTRYTLSYISQLVSYRRTMDWGAWRGTAFKQVLGEETGQVKWEMFRRFREFDKKNEQEVLKRVRWGRRALVDNEIHLRYYMLRSLQVFKRCDFHVSKEPLYEYASHIAVRKGFPYMNRFNERIGRVIQRGLYAGWVQKHWARDSECNVEPKVYGGDKRVVEIPHIEGALWVLGIGWASAFTCLFIEYLRKRRYMNAPRELTTPEVSDGMGGTIFDTQYGDKSMFESQFGTEFGLKTAQNEYSFEQPSTPFRFPGFPNKSDMVQYGYPARRY